ncbi:Phototropic-responsive NPH3 family protein isoform 1 [Senna tora]|uniref:Phototropic-responsive NPH3 family protein isoform 1 n=1 Tax=Senna tora TaxID=362788 RepID=A0A834SUI4_9FABA|nr:Phototropic-responsive NPH3 family protein isoform 1 [Senna tora]
MCFRVECKSCGKYTWAGCGKHLKALYSSIDEGKHCMCRSWPGVVIPNQPPAATSTPQQPIQSGSGPQGCFLCRQWGILELMK